jgi:diguanylate cyclase (GGDEF)-like protein/PAS domain S-box-containing protein
MSTNPQVGRPTGPGSAPDERRAKASRRAADALLREHPDAVVFAQSRDGHIVPLPASLGLDGYPVLASDGRTGVDLCVAEDRMTVVNAWLRLKKEAVAEARARLRSDPEQWHTVRMLDLCNTHGVVLSIVWASDGPDRATQQPAQSPRSTAPRFGSRKQDREGNVIECDEAYLQMLGYRTPREVIGQPTFERVHPDDQARLIESWIAMIATGRVQMVRIRVRRQDDSWLWVDTTYHNYLDDDERGYVLAESIDVSAEMAAQETLQDREELLRRVLEEMPDGLLQLDRERNVVYRNTRSRELLGEDPAQPEQPSKPDPFYSGEVALSALTKALTEEARSTLDAVIERALSEGESADVELEAMLAFGERRQILFKVRPLLREDRLASGVIASLQDVTESSRARRELERRATFDSLTGVHNRASIIAALKAELELSSETGVVYVDLDDFKAVNDTLGHAAGDEVLVQAADRLRGAMRGGDELGRLGGDEFVILLRGVSGLGVALGAAGRINEALRGKYELAGGSLELRASVGVACARETSITAEQLIERADSAMYRSKQDRLGEPVLSGPV